MYQYVLYQHVLYAIGKNEKPGTATVEVIKLEEI